MKILQGASWTRNGITLLWQAESLAQICKPAEAVSIRYFMSPAQPWCDELPAANGDALVVVGIEGCIDVLTPDDAAIWIEEDLKQRIFDFQSEYEGQAALIFWLPGGRQRIRMDAATEEYSWICSTAYTGQTIALGRHLWSGAESDVRRVIDGSNPNPDIDGPAWVGLHHPRIS